jgi:trigger factor
MLDRNGAMEVTETVKEDLHREFKIVVVKQDLDDKLTGKLNEMQPRIHLKGFRPGKAPVSYLKRAYGKSLMGEIVNNVVNESSEQALKDRELKPATAPRIDFANEIERVVEGKADLEFTMKVDLMPDFDVASLSDLKAERLVAEVSDEDVESALKRIADQQKVYLDKGEGSVAEMGDALTIDFEGKIDGTPFEGGKGDNFDLTLGSGAFIPGFEDQLVGARAGDQRTVKVTFPENYGRASLAGKDAEFDVTVKNIKAASDVVIDDALAQSVGMNDLPALRDALRNQLKTDFGRASRTHLKRRILDALDEAHHFSLPSGMVEAEFGAIWKQVEAEIARDGKTAEEADKTDDELRAEYRAIAERRVRLGLVLAKIGEQNGLSVSQEELNRAVAAQARKYPGQEQKVYDFITNNPQALAEIRVPLFEDKVVDFIAELIKISDRSVDRETLFMDPDSAAEKLDAAAPKETKAAKAEKEEKPKDEKPKAKKKKKEE